MENTIITSPTNYASFGRRFVALLIDGIIIGIMQGIVIAPFLGMIGFGAVQNVENLENMSDQQAMGVMGAIMGASAVLQVVSLVVSGAYFTLMHSSEKQASIGKMAMGIKVTDMNGNRITRQAAFIRFIGTLVSGAILCIGYIMAAFTEKKQALHDMIANTLVLK